MEIKKLSRLTAAGCAGLAAAVHLVRACIMLAVSGSSGRMIRLVTLLKIMQFSEIILLALIAAVLGMRFMQSRSLPAIGTAGGALLSAVALIPYPSNALRGHPAVMIVPNTYYCKWIYFIGMLCFFGALCCACLRSSKRLPAIVCAVCGMFTAGIHPLMRVILFRNGTGQGYPTDQLYIWYSIPCIGYILCFAAAAYILCTVPTE